MNMRLLILTGGAYHDFDAFDSFAAELFEADGYDVHLTRDPADVARPNADVVLIYTCYVQPPSDPNASFTYLEGISDADSAALAEWVRGGGGLLALHSATTIRDSNTELKQLFGGRFLHHPPRYPITVYPLATEHPITDGVGSFTVFDELYTQEYGDVDVHMITVDRGTAYPMTWTREVDDGRVAHISPGHDATVWTNAAYRRLLRQTVGWLGQG